MNISEKENLDTALKYHSAGELEKAESIYLEILKSSPNNYNVLNLLGLVMLAKSELLKAKKYIKEALLQREDCYFYENLARVYMKKK